MKKSIKKLSTRTLSLLLVLCMLTSALPLTSLVMANTDLLMPMSAPVTGSIPISNPTELSNIRNNLSANYHLTQSIDLTSEWTPIDGFAGIFDGQGFEIRNLFVNANSNRENAGLFGSTSSGGNSEIRNLGIIVGNNGVHANKVSTSNNNSFDIFNPVDGIYGASSRAGGLVGRGTNLLIESCYVIGGNDVSSGALVQAYAGHTSQGSGESAWADAYAGGLIGAGSNVIISNSYTQIAVNAHAYAQGGPSFLFMGVGTGRPNAYAGGLIGYVNSGQISNSYVTNNVYGRADDSSRSQNRWSYIGDLIGSGTLKVTNAYSLPSILSSYNTERRTFRVDGEPIIDMWLRNVGYMRVAFDNFDEIWKIENNGYPIHKRPAVLGVRINPISTIVQRGGTQQFATNFDGLLIDEISNMRSATWSLSGNRASGSRISADGLLTVATDETATILTVTATSTFDRTKSGTATVTVPDLVVTVEPSYVSVEKGSGYQFISYVDNQLGIPQTVNWSILGKTSSGTMITSNGLLTIATDETATSLTVRATSNIDNNKFADATVTVTEAPPPPEIISITILPRTPSVRLGGQEQFSVDVAVQGDAESTVTWNLSGNSSVGTSISKDGLLTAAYDETSVALTVTATSTFDPTKFDTVTVKISTVSSVTVTPSEISGVQGWSYQFFATVHQQGDAPTTVDWSVTGNTSPATRITSSGLLIIAANEVTEMLTVQATSTFDPTKFDTARIMSEVAIAITLDKTTLTLQVGNSETITAKVLPSNILDKSIGTWSSSDNSVATVDQNGKVTAKQIDGIQWVEITVTTKNGEHTATCFVTVYDLNVIHVRNSYELRDALSGGVATEGRFVILDNNIDLSDFNSGVSGHTRGMWVPINDFRGTFDGNGYRIENLWTGGDKEDTLLSSGNQLRYAGLFGYTTYGTTVIKNLGVIIKQSGNGPNESAVYSASTSWSGQSTFAGGLIGLSMNRVIIDNCYVAGGSIYASSISWVDGAASYAGGLIGASINYLDDSANSPNKMTAVEISNSYVLSNVYSESCSIFGSVGGYVGYLPDVGIYASLVLDGYKIINEIPDGDSYAGGLVGFTYRVRDCTIDYSYVSGQIETLRGISYRGYAGYITGTALNTNIISKYSSGFTYNNYFLDQGVKGKNTGTERDYGSPVDTIDTLRDIVRNQSPYLWSMLEKAAWLFAVNHGFSSSSFSVQGSGENLVQVIDKDVDLFEDVYVDGLLLTLGEHYSVESGSTVITLFSSFLDTLEGGIHTLTVEFLDGIIVDDTFIVIAETRLPDGFYVVVFMDGDDLYTGLIVELGEKVAPPDESPVNEGYLFAGWCVDSDQGELYDFGTLVTQDLVLYASWEVANVDYTVNYYLTGESSPLVSSVVKSGYYGASVTEAARVIDGYTVVNSSITATLNATNNVFTFYYTKNPVPTSTPDTPSPKSTQSTKTVPAPSTTIPPDVTPPNTAPPIKEDDNGTSASWWTFRNISIVLVVVTVLAVLGIAYYYYSRRK